MADSRSAAAQSLLMVPMSVTYEKGLYKVRTHDCMERSAADVLKQRALRVRVHRRVPAQRRGRRAREQAEAHDAARSRRRRRPPRRSTSDAEAAIARRLIVYEDRHWRSLRPLTDLLPVPALAFGASDLARRWLTTARLPLFGIEARAGAMAGWHAPPALDTSPVDASDEAIVVNAAALPGAWFAAAC